MTQKVIELRLLNTGEYHQIHRWFIQGFTSFMQASWFAIALLKIASTRIFSASEFTGTVE